MTSLKKGNGLAKQGKPGIKAVKGLARPGQPGIRNKKHETTEDPITSISKRSDSLLIKVRLVNLHSEIINTIEMNLERW